jgi:hypothetical protein
LYEQRPIAIRNASDAEEVQARRIQDIKAEDRSFQESIEKGPSPPSV